MQKNLYYSLLDKNGKVISVNDYRKAKFFRFYWGNKKVDELQFGDDWSTKEKRETLDWYYHKTQSALLKNEEKINNLKKSVKEIKQELPFLKPDKYYSFYLDSNNRLLANNQLAKAKSFALYYGYELININEFKKISDSESSKRYQIKKFVDEADREIFIKKESEKKKSKEQKIEEKRNLKNEIDKQRGYEENKDLIDSGEEDVFIELSAMKYNYQIIYRTFMSQQYTLLNNNVETVIKVKKCFANPKRPIIIIPDELGIPNHDEVKNAVKNALQEAFDYSKEYGMKSIDNRYILKLTYSFIDDPNKIEPYMIIKEGNVKVLQAQFKARLEQYLEGLSTRRTTINKQFEFNELFESFWKKVVRSMNIYMNAHRAFGYVIRTAMVESVVEKTP